MKKKVKIRGSVLHFYLTLTNDWKVEDQPKKPKLGLLYQNSPKPIKFKSKPWPDISKLGLTHQNGPKPIKLKTKPKVHHN